MRIGRLAAAIASLVMLACAAAPANAAFTKVANLAYDIDALGPDTGLNRLDLYLPDGAASGDRRPVVIYAHGGGWMNGDKTNRMSDKPRLFTDAGYIFASVNYRLSPDISDSPPPPEYAADRLRFPEHPRDLGEAAAWLSRNVGRYGGDPDAMILTGHSAGAHLVSLVGSDPSYLAAHDVSLRQVLGVVSLDAGALDVVDSATQTGPQPTANNLLIWNAFGTPAEEAASPRWHRASPTSWGDPTDPRSLLVTQAARPVRIAESEKMAAALGQGPDSVLRVPLDHEGINDALGSPGDASGETAAVMTFIRDRVKARSEPVVRIRKRPARVIRIGRGQRKRKVVFGFEGESASGVECRMDAKPFRRCRSPRAFHLKRGRHTFKIRALYPSGRPATVKSVTFRIKPKRG
ncbi:MAG TPA: alpha/beta hydrolase [Solirubrobacterales bacterium]|nr:alpha/beta hydrolase [Solirubrobacterales bacterium]